MTTILNTIVWNWIWFEQFTAIAINEKEMLNMNLTGSIILLLYSTALSDQCLHIVAVVSAICIQCSLVRAFCHKYKPGETFVFTLGPFKRDEFLLWLSGFQVVLSEFILSACEIHFLDVCVWFYCLCNRCKWWIWFEVVNSNMCVWVVCVCDGGVCMSKWLSSLLIQGVWCHLLSVLGTIDGYRCSDIWYQQLIL